MERRAYLAGLWYPEGPEECRRAIERHAEGTEPRPGHYRGLIGPHAGWAFSGDCAARTFRWLADRHAGADLVVVFGSHRGREGPNTIFRGDAWDTPLGPLWTDHELAEQLANELPLSDEPLRPMRPDNGAELHLPFVRYFFPEAKLLMIGPAASKAAATLGRRVGELAREGSRDAVFVGSTDLTHYGPSYGFAPAGRGAAAVDWVRRDNDAGFIEAILRDEPLEALTHALERASACCPGSVVAAMEATRAYHGHVQPALVEHYLSCDVRPGDSFVGYGGLVI